MPQLVVTIDAKTYRMACAEGEEQHLAALAADVDRRIAELRGSFGEIGDLRLTVMAAITLADDLSETKRRMADASAGKQGGDAARAAFDEQLRRERALMAERLVEAAEAVERLDGKLRRHAAAGQG